MPHRTLSPEAIAGSRGKWVKVTAVDPQTVCCDESLMVCAMRTVGVRQHPAFPFEILIDEHEGKARTTWRWVVATQSADGLYSTDQLVKWWKDKAWQAANRGHEFSIVCQSLRNMGVQAGEVRNRIPRLVVRHGAKEARIPVNASAARRQWLMDRLRGRIPMNTPFVEEVPGS